MRLPPACRGVGIVLSVCEKGALGGSPSKPWPAGKSDSRPEVISWVMTPGPTDFRGLLRMLICEVGVGRCLLRGLFASGISLILNLALSSLGIGRVFD